MKTKCHLVLSTVFACLLVVSCSLDYEPVSMYSDITEGVVDVKPIFADRAAALNARTTLIHRFREGVEHWYVDMLLLNETHTDNAYAGTGGEPIPFAVNSIDENNINLARDWTQHMANVARTNHLIWGVEPLTDLSDAEKRQFKAEGKILRAMIYFDMVRMWGNLPLITDVAKDITAENITELYPFYFPPQSDELTVYQQIERDLLEALEDALDIKPNNKDKNEYATLPSKQVARALLAKMYAEKPLRDYDKVIKYADELAADGFDLVADLEDLWGVVLYDPDKPLSDDNNNAIASKDKHTMESIYEAAYFIGATSGGVYRMFLPSYNNGSIDSYGGIKRITPTRDIIRDFTSETGDKRYQQAVLWEARSSAYSYWPSWGSTMAPSGYFPPFMYKCRSSFNSIIKIRYADILLLKAEALISKNDFNGAVQILNRIRNRAGLSNLPSLATAGRDAILKAYRRERRLELAFEGERWFDLCRWEMVEEVMNTALDRDEGLERLVYPFDQFSYKMPIPWFVIEANSNFVQNPGY